MITRIEKSYARTVNIGNYENVRIEIKLEKKLDKELTPKEIVQISNKLLTLEKLIIEEEAKKLLIERQSKQE